MSENENAVVDKEVEKHQMTGPSSLLIEESLSLLNLTSSQNPTARPLSPDFFGNTAVPHTNVSSLTPVKPLRFERIDFDDRLSDINPKKPAWKSLQENIKDSYNKAKISANKKKEENEFMEDLLLRRTHRTHEEAPFRNLSLETGFIPTRSPSFVAGSYDRPSESSWAYSRNGGTGPYAAPALPTSRGIESRYEERANKLELMLLKSAPLPERYKTITTREFRNAPEPDTYSEKDDYDFSHYTTARPYYSRPNRDDPDYFDFDLQHSVDMFKRPEGKYTPRRPQEWENKLISESSTKGAAPLSGHMFKQEHQDWRNNGTSYLSAALRTPKFWEQRFENIGKHVRDSNPISLESINRNRPTPSRFTEYRDPDYEDYENSLDDD